MSSSYFKNFFGMRCTDLEMLRVPNPELELTIQVTLRTVQCGTLIGSVLVGPLKYFLNYSNFDHSKDLRLAVSKNGLLGATLGLIAGPIISALWFRNLDSIKKFDRCYRLRFNTKNINVDRCALIGACAGAAIDGRYGFVLGMDMALLVNFLFTGRSPFSFNIDY